MRISRIHLGVELAIGEVIALDQRQSHYLRQVLRLDSGAAIIVFDGRQAIDYHARLVIAGKITKLRIESSSLVDNESPLDSEIIQGLARTDHLDWMIQKTTELGVNRIRIFNAERTQSPLKPAQQEKKLAHWQAVATGACEQSGRAILPQISFHRTFEQALDACAATLKLILDFNGEPLGSVLLAGSGPLAILVGPEGGLNQTEIAQAGSTGFRSASLGKRILRTETAAAAALAIAQSSLGDLG